MRDFLISIRQILFNMVFDRKELSFPIEAEDSVRTAFDIYSKKIFGFEIARSRDEYPDNELRVLDHEKLSTHDILNEKTEGEKIGAEVETFSSNFDHDPEECSLIICWLHDWKECPKDLDVLQLAPYFTFSNNNRDKTKCTNITLSRSPMNEKKAVLQLRLNGIRAGVKIIKECSDGRKRPQDAVEFWGPLNPNEENVPADSFPELLERMGSEISEDVFLNLNVGRLWDFEDWIDPGAAAKNNEVRISYGESGKYKIVKPRDGEIILRARDNEGKVSGKATKGITEEVFRELLSEIDKDIREKTFVENNSLGFLWEYWLKENTNLSLPSWFLLEE